MRMGNENLMLLRGAGNWDTPTLFFFSLTRDFFLDGFLLFFPLSCASLLGGIEPVGVPLDCKRELVGIVCTVARC